MKSTGQKRNDLIISGKIAHKVLLFGKKLVGEKWNYISFNHQNATIKVSPFPENQEYLGRLAEYTLVILDYSTFLIGHEIYHGQQDIFEKQMMDALKAGTTFCFVYYDENVPRTVSNAVSQSGMDPQDINECHQTQIGFRWLRPTSIKPLRSKHLLPSSEPLSRQEFKLFLDKWGASYNFFQSYPNTFNGEIILGSKLKATAFSLNTYNHRIVYLPFQRDHSRLEDLQEAIETLIDSLLTYIVNNLTEIPNWGPFFQGEVIIQQKHDELKLKLGEIRKELDYFTQAKSLLFQSKYELERTVPQFLLENLNILTSRDETYKEDFWILNEAQEKIAIVEVKSVVKGLGKGAIFQLYNQRENNKLNEAFPALLVVNCNRQAGSWKDKDRPINKEAFRIAAQNNILIIRIEDLLRLWDLKENGAITSDEIIGLFTKNKGWLQVNVKLEIKIKK